MKPKIVLYKRIPNSERKRLEEHFEVSFFDGVNAGNRRDFIQSLTEANGLIGASLTITAIDLQCAKSLRAVSTISTGTDRFDLNDLSERNIPLMHTPSVLTETTAETIFTLVLCAARRVVELSTLVKEGRWCNSLGEEFYGVNLHGKTMGIIGMGRIGYALAKRAYAGFDMSINYYNRSINIQAEKKFGATRMTLSQIMSESDFVCVALPLTAETQGLIGKEQFELMKPDGIFVNGARGKIIDEQALIEVLKTNKIKAAGLDVFEEEPLSGTSPLCSMDNAVLFPHIGSATVETRQRMVACAVDNLINALSGNLDKDCANIHLLN